MPADALGLEGCNKYPKTLWAENVTCVRAVRLGVVQLQHRTRSETFAPDCVVLVTYEYKYDSGVAVIRRSAISSE